MINQEIYFSINLCCYNSEKYLSETINSIVSQKYKLWELIIINDGSTDDTEKIIFEYVNKKLPIKYFKQINKGFASARNKALELSKYDWIVIIDHDDICLPERLLIHHQQILKDKKAKLFFGDTIHFNNANQVLRKNFDLFDMKKINLEKKKASFSLLKYGCFIDSESVLFNKQAAMQINGFNNQLKYITDYDFFIRMGEKFSFSFTYSILSKWRVHDLQATKKLHKTYKKEHISLLFKYIFLKYNSLELKFKLMIRVLRLIIKLILLMDK